MYENNIHTIPDRIVSISQPYIRPIVRREGSSTRGVQGKAWHEHRWGQNETSGKAFVWCLQGSLWLAAPLKDIRNGLGINRKGFLRTRFAGTGEIFRSVGSMASGHPDQRWEEPEKMHYWQKSRKLWFLISLFEFLFYTEAIR